MLNSSNKYKSSHNGFLHYTYLHNWLKLSRNLEEEEEENEKKKKKERKKENVDATVITLHADLNG